jgi:hypothetical protein
MFIDEASAVMRARFFSLLNVYPNVQKITIFGDAAQLPPFGTPYQQGIIGDIISLVR